MIKKYVNHMVIVGVQLPVSILNFLQLDTCNWIQFSELMKKSYRRFHSEEVLKRHF